MIYLYSFLLLLLYLINEQNEINKIVVILVSGVLFFLSYTDIKKKFSWIVLIAAFMIISLPFSWNPFWGGKRGDSILSWYYLWTGLAVVLLFAVREKYLLKEKAAITIVSLFLLLYSFIPLIMSKSLGEGMKEFLMIGVFLLIILGTNVSKCRLTGYDKNFLIRLYIYEMALMSLGMIIQFIGYKFLGMRLFGIQLGGAWDNQVQTGCYLLMEDASSGTIMLGAGAMLALVHRRDSKIRYFELILIIIGMACSGRRTGIVMLIVFMLIYLLLGLKSLKEKISYSLVFAGLGTLSLYFMSQSRGINSIERMFYNNGRLQLMKEGIQIFLRSPVFGYGFDNNYIAMALMPSRMIVHNSLIRWLDMGGIIYGALMMLIFVHWCIIMRKRKCDDFKWAIIYSFFAGMLIPDLLNARFMYVIALISLLIAQPASDSLESRGGAII